MATGLPIVPVHLLDHLFPSTSRVQYRPVLGRQPSALQPRGHVGHSRLAWSRSNDAVPTPGRPLVVVIVTRRHVGAISTRRLAG
jgi:hypothetical protein